jgi:hypothetical protein
MKTNFLRGLLMVFGIGILAAAGLAQVTVYGTNSYPADVGNLQAAVASNTTIYLVGTFNFGTDGQVVISVPGVTLEGVGKTTDADGNSIPVARIIGGNRPISTPGVANVAANLTIRNIAFQDNTSYAIFVNGVQPVDSLTLIEDNLFEGGESGIGICFTGGSIEIKNNILRDIMMYNIETRDLPLPADQRIIVSGNKLFNVLLDAISVGIWNVLEGDRAHGPVLIKNNYVHGKEEFNFATGIDTGNCNAFPWSGTNNAVVENNVMAGRLAAGLRGGWFGHGRRIVGNDLSALTTWQFQIALAGSDDVALDNILGPLDVEMALGFGVGFMASGIAIWSNAPWGIPPIPPPTTNNVCTRNDFRLTGLPGWRMDPATNTPYGGCILLASAADFWPGFPANEVTDNLVKETGRFPRGTGGPKQQVLEYPVMAHDNRIIGHAANEYVQLKPGQPLIGSKIMRFGAGFSPFLSQGALRPAELRKRGKSQ